MMDIACELNEIRSYWSTHELKLLCFIDRRQGDRVSDAGSAGARGPRKDSVRSMDSFSSFDPAGIQGAAHHVSVEPAPETPTADVPADTTQEHETPSTVDVKPDVQEKTTGKYQIILKPYSIL